MFRQRYRNTKGKLDVTNSQSSGDLQTNSQKQKQRSYTQTGLSEKRQKIIGLKEVNQKSHLPEIRTLGKRLESGI